VALAVLLGVGGVACSRGSNKTEAKRKPPSTVITSTSTSTSATTTTTTTATATPPATATTSEAAPSTTTSEAAPSTTTSVVAPSTTTSEAAPSTTTAPPTELDKPGAPAPVSLVAHANNPQTAVLDAPGGGQVEVLANPIASGAPLVFLVVQQQPDWLQVMLPTRPNGSTGWIKASDVTLSPHDFRMDVVLSQHLVTVMKGADQILQAPIAVGTSDTPTPAQTFYITELLKPTDANGNYIPDGDYGPYAYGLSGHSDVLQTFGAGDGQLGIHGTNAPQLIGTDVSHGCIRMTNENITTLANLLPLGVPVRVFP